MLLFWIRSHLSTTIDLGIIDHFHHNQPDKDEEEYDDNDLDEEEGDDMAAGPHFAHLASLIQPLWRKTNNNFDNSTLWSWVINER